MTVASLATITHSRPDTRPIPVMIPAPGASPSYSPWAASGESSRNGLRRVEQRVDPVAGQQLAALDVPGARALRTAQRGGGELLAQVGDEGAVDVGAGRGGCGGGHAVRC